MNMSTLKIFVRNFSSRLPCQSMEFHGIIDVKAIRLLLFMKKIEIDKSFKNCLNLNESSHGGCHIISRLVNLINLPFKLKKVIWDICMSENRCLQIRNKDLSFLFDRAIRQVK